MFYHNQHTTVNLAVAEFTFFEWTIIPCHSSPSVSRLHQLLVFAHHVVLHSLVPLVLLCVLHNLNPTLVDAVLPYSQTQNDAEALQNPTRKLCCGRFVLLLLGAASTEDTDGIAIALTEGTSEHFTSILREPFHSPTCVLCRTKALSNH